MANWTPLGDRAVRFARPAVSARTLVRAIRAWPGVIDVVVAADTIAAYYEREPAVDPGAIAALAKLRDLDEPVRDIELRVVYDGVDLEDIARELALGPEDVEQLHAGSDYVVENMGFAPGFAYLSGLDERLHLPRRATPRERVPANSVAIADAFSAVYPFDSSGGWHIIGRVVGVRMFDAGGPYLRLGDRVRFVAVS